MELIDRHFIVNFINNLFGNALDTTLNLQFDLCSVRVDTDGIEFQALTEIIKFCEQHEYQVMIFPDSGERVTFIFKA